MHNPHLFLLSLNNGYLTYVNKEKALNYLHFSERTMCLYGSDALFRSAVVGRHLHRAVVTLVVSLGVCNLLVACCNNNTVFGYHYRSNAIEHSPRIDE